MYPPKILHLRIYFRSDAQGQQTLLFVLDVNSCCTRMVQGEDVQPPWYLQLLGYNQIQEIHPICRSAAQCHSAKKKKIYTATRTSSKM